MIFWLIALLLFFILGIAALELLQQDSGYVLVSLYGTTIETSLVFALFIVVIICLVIFLSLYLSSRMIKAFRDGSQWFVMRRINTIENNYREALLHFLTGNYQQANILFNLVSNKKQLPVVRAIASAHSLAQAGNVKKALMTLERAEKIYVNDRAWLLKAKFILQYDGHEYESAKTTLDSLLVITDGDSVVKRFELKLLSKLNSHQELVEQNLKTETKLLTTPQNNDLLYDALLAAASFETHDAKKVELLWAKLDKQQRQMEKYQIAYAYALRHNDKQSKARTFIEKALNQSWVPELVSLYGQLDDDIEARLKKAESWKKLYPQESHLLIIMAKMAVQLEFWGQARSYLESSLSIDETPEALCMLGDIAEVLGKNDESIDYYKRSAHLYQS